MKKPTLKMWLRQKRIARYRVRHRLKRRHVYCTPKANRFVKPGGCITAPRRFDALNQVCVEVIKFLRAVAHTVLGRNIATVLDFRLTESFSVAGTILLYAECDRIVSLSPLSKPITIKEPRLRKPREVLKQIGLFELVGDKCDVVPTRADVVYWRYTKGADASGDNLALLEPIAEHVNKDSTHQFELKAAWRGVSEAVANSVEHAYKYPRADGFSGLIQSKWWMFTQFRDGELFIAVCDLGCGYRATIDHTLPEKFINQLRATFGKGNIDSFAIHAAMEYGRSGTHLTERGRGSRDAMSILAHHGQGELMIMSNTGWLHYTYAGGKEVRQHRGALDIDIRGTVVWWKLPLKDIENDSSQHRA